MLLLIIKETTDTFNIDKEVYLRYNPEPEIWTVGSIYDKFFWIGSLFRKEKKLSPIHKKEFTVVDIYIKDYNRENIISFFFKMLEHIEQELNLPLLSKFPIEYIDHSELEKYKSKNKKYWLIVKDYPMEESFYDEKNEIDNRTKKFEIYFVNNGDKAELAVGGNLDKNLNPRKLIKGEAQFINKEALNKRFIGFGFGVERLIYLYKNIE